MAYLFKRYDTFTRLRILFRKEWGFKSLRAHQFAAGLHLQQLPDWQIAKPSAKGDAHGQLRE